MTEIRAGPRAEVLFLTHKIRRKRRKTMKIIDSYNAVVGSVVAVLSYMLGATLDPVCTFSRPERGGLAYGLDEKQNCPQRELQRGLERGTQEARVLAYDCSSIWSKHGFCRDR